jgi:hypothetical protein
MSPRAVVQHHLTAAQARLLERHERGLRRLASTLSARNGVKVVEIMLTLADRKGRIGRALSAALPTSIGPVVLPGRAAELGAWVARLAVHGPVWHFTEGTNGIPVIVIDQHDVMAVVRLLEPSS